MRGIDGAMIVTKAVSALRTVLKSLDPRRLFEVRGSFEISVPLDFSPVNVPEGYTLIGGENNIPLSTNLQKLTGLTTALVGPGVYSPDQDGGLTFRFLDQINFYMNQMLKQEDLTNSQIGVLVIGPGTGLDAMAAFHQAKLLGLRKFN